MDDLAFLLKQLVKKIDEQNSLLEKLVKTIKEKEK